MGVIDDIPSPFGPVGNTGTVPVFSIFSSSCSCSIAASSSSSSASSMGSPVCGPFAIAVPISLASSFCSVSSSLSICQRYPIRTRVGSVYMI